MHVPNIAQVWLVEVGMICEPRSRGEASLSNSDGLAMTVLNLLTSQYPICDLEKVVALFVSRIREDRSDGAIWLY